jgi:ADP-ribose pyrophosphatase YjhB (NUDIX family)
MKNFEVVDKETNKKHWISRSMAVTVVPVVISKEGEVSVLVETRGPGCPDNIGKHVFPCGYLDYDETLREAGARELYEEIGLKVKPENLIFFGINDDIKSNLQNVTARFVIVLDAEDILGKMDSKEINTDTKSRGGEENEVSEVSLVPLSKYDDSEQWAFGHLEIAKSVIKNLAELIEGTYKPNV